MKLIRRLAFCLLLAVCVVGALVSFGAVPQAHFDGLPFWLRVALALCFAVFSLEVFWGGFRVRRSRAPGAGKPTSTSQA